MNDKTLTVTVVGRRCVYINDYRVVGSKPYVSENLPSWSFEADINDLRYAIGRRPSSANKALQARVDVLEAEKANAANALTTLSAERDDLQRRLDNICMNIHTCSGDSCERPVCVERRKGDKLREALHFYADYHPQPSEGPWGADSRDFGDIARQALAGDDHG